MKRFRRGALLLISILLLFPFVGHADTPSVRGGVLDCAFTAPNEVQEYVSHLSDGDADTTVTLYRGESLAMRPSGSASALYFDFYERPGMFTLTYTDAHGAVLGEERIENADYLLFRPVPNGSPYEITLTVREGTVRLSEWLACTDAFIPPFADEGKPADVLAVLNEPGDELLRFGGLFAMLSGEHGLSVQVVYLTQADGYKTHQCMDVLSRMGVTRMPQFGTQQRTAAETDVGVYNAFGGSGALRKQLVELIRTVRPTLLVTLDAAAEQPRYSDGAIVRAVLTAAEFAADPQRYPDTEAHTVSKIYTLTGEGGTTLSMGEPLYAYGGETAEALSRECLALYKEERVLNRKVPDALHFLLAASAVGEDEAQNDLLEHLPLSGFAGYRAPTPAPTEAPTPEATEAPTPEPASEPTDASTAIPTEAPAVTKAPSEAPTAAPEPTTEPAEEPPAARPRSAWLCTLPAVIGAGLGAALFFLLRKKHAAARILCALLPILLGAALTVTLFVSSDRTPAVKTAEQTPAPTEAPTPVPIEAPTPGPTSEPTPEPVEAPTPEPTAEPTPEPTAEPTPTPDPNAAYFLDTDGEEYEMDFENGHWRYRSRVLSIEIEEIHTSYEDKGPLVCYIADIRMREYSSYRSGLMNDYRAPWRFARLDSAVLAVTADCVRNEPLEKGVLIRRGEFYTDYGNASALVIEDDGMSMRIERANTVSKRVLLDQGVRDTYSFGPTLVENGRISEEVQRHRVKHVNPRAGIGMVEPGHWIAIVTDGRQPGYSMSISLDFFAEMFLERGCTVAYNMDGGSSAGMIFMGETLNKHKGAGTDDVQRSWMDAIEFGYSEQVPDPSAPLHYPGYH